MNKKFDAHKTAHWLLPPMWLSFMGVIWHFLMICSTFLSCLEHSNSSSLLILTCVAPLATNYLIAHARFSSKLTLTTETNNHLFNTSFVASDLCALCYMQKVCINKARKFTENKFAIQNGELIETKFRHTDPHIYIYTSIYHILSHWLTVCEAPVTHTYVKLIGNHMTAAMCMWRAWTCTNARICDN